MAKQEKYISFLQTKLEAMGISVYFNHIQPSMQPCLGELKFRIHCPPLGRKNNMQKSRASKSFEMTGQNEKKCEPFWTIVLVGQHRYTVGSGDSRTSCFFNGYHPVGCSCTSHSIFFWMLVRTKSQRRLKVRNTSTWPFRVTVFVQTQAFLHATNTLKR